jgi:hypothetical protein
MLPMEKMEFLHGLFAFKDVASSLILHKLTRFRVR